MRTLLLCLALSFPACAADWQPLFDGKSLAGWTPTKFAGAGEIEVSDGALVLNQGLLTGISLTNPTPTVDYEVELEARRMLGIDFFCGLTFPVKDSFATLVVGGWGGAVVGISSIDGEDAAHNATTSYRRFKNSQWYRIRLAVTATNLSVWIDGDRVVDADIAGKTIALRAGEIEASKPFGIATWSTTAELRDIKLRKLEPKARALPGSGGPEAKGSREAPAATKPAAIPATPPAPKPVPR